MASKREEKIMARIREAVAGVLEEEGVSIESVEGAIVMPDGRTVNVSFDDDGDGDEDESGLGDAEVREVAAAAGRGEQFDEVADIFNRIEAAHEHTTKGQDALAAIDKLAEGQPLRALFATAKSAKAANAEVVKLVETADLDLLMTFLYELGMAVDLLPKLHRLLGRRLAMRVTGHVTGIEVTPEMMKRLETAAAGRVDASDHAKLEQAITALKGVARTQSKRKEKTECTCPVCTQRREHERRNLN